MSIPEKLNFNANNVIRSLTKHANLKIVNVKMVPKNMIGGQLLYLGRSRFLWGLKLIKYLRPSLRNRIQGYEYKISYESKYLFRMRKAFATNY